MRKGGLEGHIEPLGGRQAGPPGPLCPVWPVREVMKATGPGVSSGLAIGNTREVRSAEQAFRAARLVGSERSPASYWSR